MVYEMGFKSGSRSYNLLFTKIKEDETTEQYKLWAARNPAKYIILQNNRPLLRNKLNLKHKKIAWKVVEGQVKSRSTLEKVIEIMENAIDR